MRRTAHDKTAKGRLLAALFLWMGLGGLAHGQSDATPPSAAQSLSCLQRPTTTLSYPERHRFDRSHGSMRLRLHFDEPNSAPRVEVLANTARQDMQDRVYRYVAGYRLPCLKPTDGRVSAVQEFDFSNSSLEPLPVPESPTRRLPFCIVQPRKDMQAPHTLSREVAHVVASAVFSGPGEQPPEVKLLHTTGNRALEEAVIERVRSYRMPCRTGGEEPQVMRQQFTFVPVGYRRAVLKQETFPLARFLGMTQGAQQLKAHFDFTTMNCPFKVDYMAYGPSLPNEVRALDRLDPNRVPFLRWLEERHLAFSSEEQANDLFGERIQIEVPCGKLDLDPDRPATGG